jgi:type VII secretion-associated protein (TIGR03931 family)
MTGAVVEVGPAAVALLSPRRAVPVQPDMVTAALAGIDDTTVLVHERPVAVVDLWRTIIAASAGTDRASLTVVHPSWWSPQRVARIVDVAATVAANVLALPRSAAAGGESAVVIEIADDIVAVSLPGEPVVRHARPDNPADIADALEIPPGTTVLIDAPAGVAGAAEYARGVRASLCQHGVTAQPARMRAAAPVPAPEVAATPPPMRRRRGLAVATAAVALTLGAIGASAARPTPPPPSQQTGLIVEGRIALRVPNDWVITRITAGPGSRRLQVNSPAEQHAALHVTQSFTPGETLEHAAELLREAVVAQPHGVFLDFTPADVRGGRPAVTYREVRVGRDIRWAVFLDGSTRISVGCQSAPEEPDIVAQPCEQAIASAHELTGTDPGR